MTNAEKFLKDGVDIENFANSLCEFVGNFELRNGIKNFLNKEAKPTLTEDERVILRNIAKHNDFEKIGRGKIGGLYVTCRINIPTVEKWGITFFDHLFQFIKERRRI